MAVSLGLLGVALRTLPLGTAYAVWTGIGATGAVLLGIVLFGESASAARLGIVVTVAGGTCREARLDMVAVCGGGADYCWESWLASSSGSQALARRWRASIPASL